MESRSRREFLSAVAWAGLGATCAAGAWPLVRYAAAPVPPRAQGPRRISLGPPSSMAVGSAQALVIAGKPVLAIRSPEGIVAVSSRCTHYGCLVRWDPDAREIRCPCHGGRFDASGKVLGGPPPRPLDPVPVSVEEGQVWVGG